MSEIRFESIHMQGSSIGENSTVPALHTMNNVQFQSKADIDEDDGLFLGYGYCFSMIPYLYQESYTRKNTDLILKTAVIENQYLRAVFLPELGGRLQQLYDKVQEKDLIYVNDVIRPCNLALRNAWLSGGVEWNIGMTGHTPFTCAPLHTAVVDGNPPVLRMYEYERIRNVIYQMDFFLPDDSRYLHCRMRIVNPNSEVIPMYWWSNIAVPALSGSRVIVPADEAFSNGTEGVYKMPVATDEFDASYPENSMNAKDYFFNLKGPERYICYVDKDGKGLLQASTSRLQGRKLFVWGKGEGSQHWQQFLTEKAGNYCEIQAGLAKTQYESIPMPPYAAYEWLELYGPIALNADEVHGSFTQAVRTVSRYVQRDPEISKLEETLRQTKEKIALQKGRSVLNGSGWAALENERRQRASQPPLPQHLDYGHCHAEQEIWLQILNETAPFSVPDEQQPPLSYMNQKEWTVLLRKWEDMHEKNWWTQLQLGVSAYASLKFTEAAEYFLASLQSRHNVWALFGLANTYNMLEQSEAAANYALAAVSERFADICLVRSMWRILLSSGHSEWLLKQSSRAPAAILADGRCRFYIAQARFYTGDIDGAEAMLMENGGLEIPDIREGETLTTDLWYQIAEKKAEKAGVSFDRKTAKPPFSLNFKMQD